MMLKHIKTISCIIILVLNAFNSKACTGGANNQGNLTPTLAYQTVGTMDGYYYSMNVVCGNVYNFDFCANGGSSGSLWPEISILDATGSTQYAFSPFSGGCSTLTWTATFTGAIRILITDSGCFQGQFYNGTMAYNYSTGGVINPSFTLASTSCNGATATITGTTGGTFTFDPLPGDGATINSSNGAISNGTLGSTYTARYTVCGSSTTQSVTLSNGNAAFSLNNFCGGATATIIGDTGGTFSFNPLPGDGTQINSSNGLVTNGTAGATYFVQYSVCGATSIESLIVTTDDCFSLSGNAQYISVAGEDCIQLTAEVNNQTGCAWNESQIDFNSDFSLSLDYYFGNNINGADGNTFTFQPGSSTACGQNGGQLGAGGLTNALSVEFDTYDNDNPAHVYDMSCDHVAIEIDENMLGPGAPFCGPVCAKAGGGNIDDGGTYEVEIVWNANSQQMQVYFNGSLRLSCTSDFVNTAFGGQNLVYWGATSATGGLNNQQYFCPSTVVVLPAEMISFNSTCEGEKEIFTWVTASEHRVDHFELEYTLNGLIFYPVGQIQAVGNSTEMNSYSMEYIPTDRTQKYFRIKTVDQDGDIETSDLISGGSCLSDEMLIGYTFHESGLTIQGLSESMEISLLNTAGQELGYVTTENAANVQFYDLKLSKGVYLLNMRNLKSGKTKVYRIYN